MRAKVRKAMWITSARLVAPLVVVVALALAGAASALRFTDAAGDSSAAPDMTSVDVTNDARGRVTFRFAFPNRSSGLDPSDLMFVLLDSDRSAATGADGNDYQLQVTQGAISVLGWDRTQARYVAVAAPTARVSMAGGVLTFVVPKAVLGNTKAFDAVFFAARVVGGAAEGVDRAPDTGDWSYALTRFCVVPNVTGRTLAAARKALVRADCRVGKLLRRRSVAKAGRVVGQSPRAGATRPRGARVNLVLSRGRR